MQPKEKIKFQEEFLPYCKYPKNVVVLQWVFTIALILLNLSYFIFPTVITDDLLKWGSVVLSMILIFSIVNWQKPIAKNIEMWVYDDRLTIYRQKQEYKKNKFRDEYRTIYYKDIKDLAYYPECAFVRIAGNWEDLYCEYVDGKIEDANIKPIKRKNKGQEIKCFDKDNDKNTISILNVIEKYTKLQFSWVEVDPIP